MAKSRVRATLRRMNSVVLLAPAFFAFEVWQLVISERYLGLKQIARNGDPRTLGLGEVTAFAWTALLFLYWGWMLALLLVPFARLPGLALLAISAVSYSIRRNTDLRMILVILTFEGAIRIGLLIYLIAAAWRRF
ncbi:MAG TPA: hypothetical protein VG710_11715 [Opitutus sp.]|nr:hypothetical protein [Opitutus sp.]